MPQSVKVISPAKLNLALDITGLMPNGYHSMDMVMQSVSLFETVDLHRASGITVKAPNSRVPSGMANIAYKAAVAFFVEVGLLAGVDITIKKAVPVRAGMAGGSADAAAVLVGLNALYEANLSQEELCKIGASVGADVPFAIIGGTARVQGIGDIINRITPIPDCYFVVCMPLGGVSTPVAFAAYDEQGTDTHPNCNALEFAITNQKYYDMCNNMGNALMFSSSAKKTNDDICRILNENGANSALMTGSGAAVFGTFNSKEKAEKARYKLLKKYKEVHLLTNVRHGTIIL